MEKIFTSIFTIANYILKNQELKIDIPNSLNEASKPNENEGIPQSVVVVYQIENYESIRENI